MTMPGDAGAGAQGGGSGEGAGGGAPAGGPPAGAAAPTGGEPGAPGAPDAGAAPEHWSSGFTDRELAELVQGKGYDGPEALAGAYRSLSKMLGADESSLVRMPREGDEEGLREVFSRLGRPAEASGYELPDPGEGQQDLREWFQGVAHGANLTQAQAKAVAEAFGGMIAEQHAKLTGTAAAEGEQIDAQLRTKWGGEYERNMEFADRALARLEWPDEALAQLRNGGGEWRGRVLELLAFVGRNQREDGFPAPGGSGSPSKPFGDTPEAAYRKFRDLSEDVRFMDRVNRGEMAAVREFQAASEAASEYLESQGNFAGGPPR